MNHNFLQAIKEKRIISVKFNSNEKGIIERRCIPFDFGPSRIYKDGQNRYHFYDLDSPNRNHNLSILPNKIMDIRIEEETFNPAEYIKWKTKWFVPREGGIYS